MRQDGVGVCIVALCACFPFFDASLRTLQRRVLSLLSAFFAFRLLLSSLERVVVDMHMHVHLRVRDSTPPQNANKIMIPDALMPVEAKLASGVRDFAKNLPRWTQQTVEGKPEPFVRTRTEGLCSYALAILAVFSPLCLRTAVIPLSNRMHAHSHACVFP